MGLPRSRLASCCAVTLRPHSRGARRVGSVVYQAVEALPQPGADRVRPFGAAGALDVDPDDAPVDPLLPYGSRLQHWRASIAMCLLIPPGLDLSWVRRTP